MFDKTSKVICKKCSEDHLKSHLYCKRTKKSVIHYICSVYGRNVFII